MVFSLCSHCIILFLLFGFYLVPFTSGILPPVQIINQGRQNLIVRCQSDGYCHSKQTIKPSSQYNLDVDLGTGPIVKAWCTMELAGKWGIFQVYNTERNDLFCDKGYCTWFVAEYGVCQSTDPSVFGCSKLYFWPQV